MNRKSINPNEITSTTDHRGSACSTTLDIQFYSYNTKYQNKENNINKEYINSSYHLTTETQTK